ncbi:MAG TPA: FAD:protein FMN transferase, partial [Thermaerobacter sp.]
MRTPYPGRRGPGEAGVGGGELLRVRFRAMDTDVEALVEVPPARRRQAARLLVWTRRWFRLLERRLSRFRPDSDVARVNRGAGSGPVGISGLTVAVLARALQLAAWSDGLFDPAGLTALEAAGYDRPLARLRRPAAGWRGEESPAGGQGEEPRPPAAPRPFFGNYRSVVLDRRARTVALPPGMGIDLGGIAKGWAADVAARVLGTAGPALVNAGGDLAAGAGPRAAGGLWRVAVDGLPGRVLEV